MRTSVAASSNVIGIRLRVTVPDTERAAGYYRRVLGIDLPVYPVKGYAITMPVKDPDAAPRLPGIDENYLVAYTPILLTRRSDGRVG